MYNMMGLYPYGNGDGLISFLGEIVWLVVGVFAAIWLWNHIKK